MNYRIIDLIEPDNGCEGFMPGDEPMVTLISSLLSTSGKKTNDRIDQTSFSELLVEYIHKMITAAGPYRSAAVFLHC